MKSAIRNPQSALERAQASLEMTVALAGALLLLFGGLKVFLWSVERVTARQQAYEQSRVLAGSARPAPQQPFVGWHEPSEPLTFFKDDQ